MHFLFLIPFLCNKGNEKGVTPPFISLIFPFNNNLEDKNGCKLIHPSKVIGEGKIWLKNITCHVELEPGMLMLRCSLRCHTGCKDYCHWLAVVQVAEPDNQRWPQSWTRVQLHHVARQIFHRCCHLGPEVMGFQPDFR